MLAAAVPLSKWSTRSQYPSECHISVCDHHGAIAAKQNLIVRYQPTTPNDTAYHMYEDQ